MAPFNHKLNKGIQGRKQTSAKIKNLLNEKDRTLWFHCASLGEYEQGLPVFKEVNKLYPEHKVILTFFSPSGYEVRKDTEIADVVVYLPWDTCKNAKDFLELVHPDLVIFVKYDIWPNFLKEVKNRNIRAILISALLRKEQSYFKWYGTVTREALFSFEHIFTQDNTSLKLLESLGYHTASLAGDTRFDRVSSQLKMDNTLSFMEEFKGDRLLIMAGSTWPEGETLLAEFINADHHEHICFLIAPHNIKTDQVTKLKKSLKKPTVLYSEKEHRNLSEQKVLILDTIGLLSKAYAYGDIAYVGGALGNTGLHNTLEAAVFGIPIIIGTHFQKFPEAKEMIDMEGMFSISTQKEFNKTLNKLIENNHFRQAAGNQNKEYIKKNKGAVIQITNYLRNY